MMALTAASLIAPMVFSLMQLVASSLVNDITGKEVIRAEKGLQDGILPLLVLPLIMKVLGKGVTRTVKEVRRARRGYNNMDHMDKNL